MTPLALALTTVQSAPLMSSESPANRNADAAVVDGFGDEWSRFDQKALSPAELETMFASYFGIFPWETLPPGAIGFDFGSGSGRWARLVAPRVGHLHCIDASAAALEVARRALTSQPNTSFHLATPETIPLDDRSMDFGYSLGVLHHVPDTPRALADCVRKLRPGAPFLLYLYYRFDNRPGWFRAVWRASDVVRRTVSHFPHVLRFAVSQILAAAVYWPLARLARAVEKRGGDAERLPLSYYRDRSFYVMRTDALDRFGTRLEQRFTRAEIEEMMQAAGLMDVRFSEAPPYWCAVGVRRMKDEG